MLHVLLSPLGLGLLILVLRHVLIKQGWRNTGWVTTPTLLVCFGLLTPLGANTLVQTLEQDSAPAPACSQDASRPLVLLSGGLDRAPRNESDMGALTPSSSLEELHVSSSALITAWQAMFGAGKVLPRLRLLRLSVDAPATAARMLPQLAF